MQYIITLLLSVAVVIFFRRVERMLSKLCLRVVMINDDLNNEILKKRDNYLKIASLEFIVEFFSDTVLCKSISEFLIS